MACETDSNFRKLFDKALYKHYLISTCGAREVKEIEYLLVELLEGKRPVADLIVYSVNCMACETDSNLRKLFDKALYKRSLTSACGGKRPLTDLIGKPDMIWPTNPIPIR